MPRTLPPRRSGACRDPLRRVRRDRLKAVTTNVARPRAAHPPHIAFVSSVAAALLTAVLGCASESGDPETDAAPAAPLFEGQTLTIALPGDPDFAARWSAALGDWEGLTGGRVQVVSYDLATSEERAIPPADVLLFPAEHFGALAGSGRLAALPEDLTAPRALAPGEELPEGLAWPDILPGWRSAVEFDGRAHAIPLGGPVLVCYYRADLLEAAGREPPETWAEYHALAHEMQSWAPGLVVAEPLGPETRRTLFLSRAMAYAQHPANRSVFFRPEDMQPFIDTPAFVRALDELRQIASLVAEELRLADVADCRRAFWSGRAALALAWEVPVGHRRDAGATGSPSPLVGDGSPSPLVGEGWGGGEGRSSADNRPEALRAGFVPLPGSADVYNASALTPRWDARPEPNRPAFVGFSGWMLGVAAGSQDSEAAVHLASYLGGGNLGNSLADVPGAGLCRESQVRDAAVWVGPELRPDEAAAYTATVAEALESRVGRPPAVPGSQRYLEALDAALQRALAEETPSQELLSEVAAEWRRITEQLGPEQAEVYRRSIGAAALGGR